MNGKKIDEATLRQRLRSLEPSAAFATLDAAAIEAKLYRRSLRRRRVRGGLFAALCIVFGVGLVYRVGKPDRQIVPLIPGPSNEIATNIAADTRIEQPVANPDAASYSPDQMLANLELELTLLSHKAEMRRLELERVKLTNDLLLSVRHRAELEYYQRVLP